LGLSNRPQGETIARSYKKLYFDTYRKLVKKHSDPSVLNEKLRLINKAYMSLDIDSTSVPINDPGFFLDLGTDLGQFKHNQPANFDVFPEFKRLLDKVDELTVERKHGLAIRLLEIGTQRSFKMNRYKAFTGHRTLIRKLGKLLLDIGMKEKGVELMTAGSINYYIGKTLFEIKDYHEAIKYFGRELQNKKAKVSSMDIVLSIVKCYFLLGEYENCLHIIERLLPNFESRRKRNLELPSKVSKMLLFCISKVENLKKGILVKFKLKLKYPVSYSCISQHIDTFKDGLVFLDEVQNEDSFNSFYKSLEPEFKVLEDVNMEYTEEDLNEIYYEIFSEPLNSSQLYNKR